MDKKELVLRLSMHWNTASEELIASLVDSIIDRIITGVLEEGEVIIKGFGKFYLEFRGEGKYHDPTSGEMVHRKAGYYFRFKSYIG